MALKSDLEAACHVDTISISKPQNTYARAGRLTTAIAIPLQNMGSEIRKRLPQLQPSKNIEQLAESSVASETELTPTSSEATEDTQGTQIQKLQGTDCGETNLLTIY